MKAQETMDAELLALAAIASVDAVTMAGDNWAAQNRGDMPPWREGTGYPPATTALYDALQQRGLIK